MHVRPTRPSGSLLSRSQSVNPLGTARFDNKYCAHVGSCLNLPASMRTDHEFLFLFGIWASKFATKEGGMARMISGIDADGNDTEEFTYRHELELLRDGAVVVNLPDDKVGGLRSWELEVEYQGSSADLLGCGQMGHTPESYSARHPCKDCMWHSSCWCAHASDSDRPRKGRQHADGCLGSDIRLRTLEAHNATLARLRTTRFKTKAARAEDFKNAGISKLFCAVEKLPGANVVDDLKSDIMHLFFCGISPKESYQMLEHFTSTGVFTWDQLNESRKRVTVGYRHTIPELFRPKTDGKTKKSIGMVMTAASCMHWVVNRCMALALRRPHLLSIAARIDRAGFVLHPQRCDRRPAAHGKCA